MINNIHTPSQLRRILGEVSKLLKDKGIEHRFVGSATLAMVGLLDRPLHDIDVEVILDTQEKKDIIEAWSTVAPSVQQRYQDEDQHNFIYDDFLINAFDIHSKNENIKSFAKSNDFIVGNGINYDCLEIDGFLFNHPLDVIKKKQEYNRPKDIEDIQDIIKSLLFTK